MGEARVRRTAALLSLLALAGCASSPPLPSPVVAPARPPPAATTLPSPAAPATPPAPARPVRDTCGLQPLGDLVGKLRSEIPVPVDLTRRRVVCEGCPVTQDLRPDRQTIWYDQATGRVTRTQCG